MSGAAVFLLRFALAAGLYLCTRQAVDVFAGGRLGRRGRTALSLAIAAALWAVYAAAAPGGGDAPATW